MVDDNFWKEEELLKLINQIDDAESFKTILGLNSRQAKNLLEFKSRHGPLTTLNDLLEVPGIGERTLEKIRFLKLPEPQESQERLSGAKIRDSSEKERCADYILWGVWGIIRAFLAFLITYFLLLSIANNGHGWFIASSVVGSIVLFFLLLLVLGTWLDTADPARTYNLLGSIPLFLAMLFGVIFALIRAPGQFPSLTSPSPPSPAKIAHASAKLLPPHFSCDAMRSYFGPWSSWLGGTVVAVQCEQLNEKTWHVIGRVRFDKYQPSDSWLLKFIDRFIIIARNLFQSEYSQFIQSVRLEAEALYVTVYGDQEWRLVLAATFPKAEARKVENWETFKNQCILQPSLFFDVMEDVFVDI